MDSKQLASQCRQAVFGKLTPEQVGFYKSLCVDFRSSVKPAQAPEGLNGDQDFFDYAANLAADFKVWKPFLLKLHKLGRYCVDQLDGEDAKEKLRVAYEKAKLMGTLVTPLIKVKMFVFCMFKEAQDQKKCLSDCQKVFDEVKEEDQVAKAEEKAEVVRAAAERARGTGHTGNLGVTMTYNEHAKGFTVVSHGSVAL